ncbi:MAG: HAMP domain-containing histidine kinase [Acidobacteria bacterium]|nr:HAMP domain-containing histidine kinase [Acidobacteriota bacterium]
MPSSRNWLVIALLTITGTSFLALVVLGWQSLDSFQAATARVFRQASVDGARELAHQIQRDLKSPVFNLLEQVDHPDVKNFHVAKIAETLRERAQHFRLIEIFFVWSLTAPSESGRSGEGGVLFYSLHGAPTEASDGEDGGAAGFFVNAGLSSVLHQKALEFAPFRKNFALSYVTFGGRTYHVVYHFLYDEDERRLLWGFLGFLADPEYLHQSYFSEVVSTWKQQQAQGTGFPLLAMSILDDNGKEVIRSGRSLLERYEAAADFPFLFFDTDLFESLRPFRPEFRYWTVRTGYEAGDVDAIARQESMRQRWAWLFVGVIAAVGIALTARATAREVQLAHMKSEFVASVSHDLKTPLAKIQLFAETLESGRARTPEKAEAYYRIISAQARKLGQLIGTLLDFSKIEAGVRSYPREELDLRAVLRSSIEMFEHELSHDYTVEALLPDTEVPVLGNADGLLQLFGNLINNALKYSPEERFLRVALSTSNGQAVVEVTDHGIGIPRDEQRRIFNKFYRGAGAVAINATGSGIGLTIVEHVARAHGGTISVTSTPRQGSTFKIVLPLASEIEEEAGEAYSGD